MPAAGTPEEKERNPSAGLSTNLGGASAKQILEVRGLPCFDLKGERNSLSVRWKRWKRAFNLYVASKGVTSEGQKVALLLHSGGIELQETYYTLVSEDQDTSFNAIALQSWITILLGKLMFHSSNMFSPKCNRWRGKLSINLCAICAIRLYPVNFQAWMKPFEIRSSKNAEIQDFVENFLRNQVKQP